MVQSVIVRGGEVYINGEKIPMPPKTKGYLKITQDGKHLCANGYEWKDGKWRRTWRAFWNYWL